MVVGLHVVPMARGHQDCDGRGSLVWRDDALRPRFRSFRVFSLSLKAWAKRPRPRNGMSLRPGRTVAGSTSGGSSGLAWGCLPLDFSLAAAAGVVGALA